MKLSKEENDKTDNILQKIKCNLNKNMIQPARLYSSFKQRPITTTKSKKQWKFNKLSNSEKSNFDFPFFGYTFHTSKYFPNKLYLNKKSFIWGKSKLKKPNKYYEKEELFDRVLKLQNTVNKLNNKNNKQQIEINKQKKEIKKQNKILNEVNFKFFFDKLLNNNEEENRSVEHRQVSSKGERKGIGVPLSKRRSYSTEELGERNYNNISNKLIDNINYENLKELYKKLLNQNDMKEQEILRLRQKIDSIKFSNETLVSNMKLQYRQLQNENNKNLLEYEELKKSTKCTKYNEVMKEKEIYEKEMHKIKNKFYKALKLLEKYKNCYQENKILIEELNKKKSKIKKLENEIVLFSKNSENLIENFKKDINKKNRKIQKLENELKKYIIIYNSIQNEDNKKIDIYNNKGSYKLYLQNQNQNNYKKEDSNPYEVKNIENNEEEIQINNYNIKENEIIIQNNNDIQNENLNSDEGEYNKNRKIYVNHCLNFSDKNNININSINNKNLTPSAHSSRANLFSASLKSINKRKEKINNIENNNIIKNTRILELINLYPELFQLFIEMKKRNINDNQIFINEVLQLLKEENNFTDNKKIYYESIVKLFNIEDTNSKKIIEDLSNKEFVENKSLQEIKIHHIKLFNELFNYKRENNKEELNKKLHEINQDEFINIINKYDNCESGYVFFNQMISITKEIKLDDYIEEILLLTKEPDIFDLMNYNNIFNIMKNNISNNDKNDIPNKDENLNKNIGEKDEITEKNENTETKHAEKEPKDNEEKPKNEGIENIFKNFAHIILIEGSTPSVYISSLKELVKIGEDSEEIEVIIPEKFFDFLEKKKISVTEEEKDEIIKQNGIKVEDKYLYIDYDKIVEKIFDYMKNDEGNSNDEDFMKNIKSMDIEGFD